MTERIIDKLDRLGVEAEIKEMTPEIRRFALLVRQDVVAGWPKRPYRPLQDNGSKYFGAWDKADEALNRMADNAREVGLDYEPDGMHHNKPAKRPQNCGTGYCSCIECVMEPAQPLPFGVGGGLVAIKTLLRHDPCVHANTAIQMIDAILAEQPTLPDAIGPNEDELPAYAAGWNDCRALMLEMRKP